MRAWTRPHGWAEVALGLTALCVGLWLISPVLTVLGALIAADGCLSLARPDLATGEAVQVVLGAVLFISPWAFAYTDQATLTWTSWVVGLTTMAVAAAAYPVRSGPISSR